MAPVNFILHCIVFQKNDYICNGYDKVRSIFIKSMVASGLVIGRLEYYVVAGMACIMHLE